MKFWDSSAIVPLCIREVHTPLAQALAAEDSDLVVWWAARTECLSALARRTRAGELPTAAAAEARQRLWNRQREWLEIPPTETIRTTADRLVAIHPLSAADAFQLAAALDWCDHRSTGAGLISLDHRLREAASREGFVVLPQGLG